MGILGAQRGARRLRYIDIWIVPAGFMDDMDFSPRIRPAVAGEVRRLMRCDRGDLTCAVPGQEPLERVGRLASKWIAGDKPTGSYRKRRFSGSSDPQSALNKLPRTRLGARRHDPELRDE